MFIIVPKRAKRVGATAEHAPDLNESAAENERGPVRTTTACGPCRIRKTKCNGQQPCGHCRRKRIICVYTPLSQREAPMSAAQGALLQRQQRRMTAAIQQMASIIAMHETGITRPPSSFDVPELLDKHVPQHADDEPEHPSLEMEDLKPLKRRRDETSLQLHTPNSSEGLERASDLPFEIRPAPGSAAGLPRSDQAYDAMMQFFRSANSDATPHMASGSTSEMQSSTLDAHHTPMANIPSVVSPQDALPFDIMHLVDWDLSLQSLHNPLRFFLENSDVHSDTMPNE